MAHKRTCHVTPKNESCDTKEWVMWHVWMFNVTHINESCHKYEWVMSYIWRRHGTQENESYDAKVWFMPTEHLQVCWGDVTTMRYWWLLLLCSPQCRCWLTSPPYVTHDPFARVPWLIRTCVMTHSMWHDSFCVFHDPFIWVSLLTHFSASLCRNGGTHMHTHAWMLPISLYIECMHT